MSYDRAGRPPLKEFFNGWEDTGNPVERRRGKLVLAKRHNFLDPLCRVAVALGSFDVIVTDSFRYFGRGGRISGRWSRPCCGGSRVCWGATARQRTASRG
jgi:hypothetical protein